MTFRRADEQTAHNEAILAEARELDRNGWEVKADHISGHGFPTPPKVNGHRPDVYATKPGGTRIIEIETDPDDDHEQHSAFRRGARQAGVNFYGWIVDKRGTRRTKFD